MSLLVNQAIICIGCVLGFVALIIGIRTIATTFQEGDNALSRKMLTVFSCAAVTAAVVTAMIMHFFIS